MKVSVKKDPLSLDILFRQLYQDVFPSVARYIAKRGGTMENAQDVFQDALIVYYEQVLCLNKIVHKRPKAYLFGIVKHLWIHQLKLGINYEAIDQELERFADEQYMQPDEHQLMHFLMNAGEKCLHLLKSFYYDKLSMSKLASQFGFSSERSATVQKFKCLEKVRGFVKEKQLQYEDFIE